MWKDKIASHIGKNRKASFVYKLVVYSLYFQLVLKWNLIRLIWSALCACVRPRLVGPPEFDRFYSRIVATLSTSGVKYIFHTVLKNVQSKFQSWWKRRVESGQKKIWSLSCTLVNFANLMLHLLIMCSLVLRYTFELLSMHVFDRGIHCFACFSCMLSIHSGYWKIMKVTM